MGGTVKYFRQPKKGMEMAAKAPPVPPGFATAIGPVMERARANAFFLKHLGGTVRFEPELVAFAERVRCPPGDRRKLDELGRRKNAPRYRDRDEVAVMSTESGDGMLSVNYRLAGYRIYLAGVRAEIITRVSLLSVGAMVLTADDKPEVLFQTRGEIERRRRRAEGRWKIEYMHYVGLPELHEFIARRFRSLTPSALFGGLFVGVRHFGEEWVGKVVEGIDKLRQN